MKKYFADLSKNMRNPRNLRNHNEKASNDGVSSGALMVTQTQTQCVTCVTKTNPVTQVTQTQTQCVTKQSNPKASNGGVSSERLRKLRKLREKQDNFVNAPPFPTGKWQGRSWGQWNGWIVGASEAERVEALEAMPDHWRYHVQRHLDSVDMLRKRANRP